METKIYKKHFIISLCLLIAFAIFTLLVKFVDTAAIGPQESIVGFSHLNGAFHNFTGVNFTIYNITDWAGLIPIFIGIIYAFIGLIQWIKRKNITKVDSNILALGIFYIIVFAFYILFEYMVINRRPTLINGILEASYPSSTTMLALCFMITSISQTNKYIKNKVARNIVKYTTIVFLSFMVIGRTISGVHWLTDIIGGVIISFSLIALYHALNSIINIGQSKQV